MNDEQQPVDVTLARIDVLNLQPGDIIALRCLRRLTQAMAEAIASQVQDIIGEDHPVMILPPELELMVVRYPLDEPE